MRTCVCAVVPMAVTGRLDPMTAGMSCGGGFGHESQIRAYHGRIFGSMGLAQTESRRFRSLTPEEASVPTT